MPASVFPRANPIPWLLFAASTGLFLLFQQGTIVHADGEEVFQLTRALVSRGSIAIHPNPDFPVPGIDNIGSPGVGDGTFSRYGVGLSLVGVLPYLIGLPFSALLGEQDLIQAFAVASSMPMICGALVAALYLLGRRLGARERASALIAFGAVAGTFVLPYTKEFFSEPLQALALVVMLERATAKRPGWAGVALAAAVLVRPQALAFAPVLGLAMLWTCGWRGALRCAIPVTAAFLFTLAYDFARFGSIIATGYETDEGFSTPIAVGTKGLLFDPEKSVIIFAPLILCVPAAIRSLWQPRRLGVLLVASHFLVVFVVTATWSGWDGDWAWGPRLLIPGLVPLMMLVAPWLELRRWHRPVVLVLIGLGFLGSAAAMVVPMQTQQNDKGNLSPEIPRQAELVPKAIDYSARHIDGRGSLDHRPYVSSWQVLLARKFGLAGFIPAVLVTLLLAALTARVGIALRRRLRESDAAPPPARGELA